MSATRNDTGSTLVLVLIGFMFVAAILSGSTALVPVLWRNTNVYGQRLLALQTAESGLQHAIAWINSKGIQNFIAQYPYKNSANAYEIPKGGSFYVVYDQVNHVLTSTGNYESTSRNLAVDVTVDGGLILFKHAVGSTMKSGGKKPYLQLDGSSKIIGDVFVNSSETGAAYLAWSTEITGDFHIGPGGDPNKVISGARPDPLTNIGGVVDNNEETAVFLMPEFPAFQTDLPNRGSFTAGWDPAPPYYISQSGSYNKIKVQSELIINLTGGEMVIQTDELSVTGDGKITLRGNGKLRLSVKNKFELTGSGSINANGDARSLSIMYGGSGDFVIPGSTKLVGSIFAKTAKVTIEGSGSNIGSIVTGGASVTLNGAASAVVRAIYAPNAACTLTGSSYVKGAIVAKTISLSGDSIVEWAEVDTADLPVEIPEPLGGGGTALFTKWRIVR